MFEITGAMDQSTSNIAGAVKIEPCAMLMVIQHFWQFNLQLQQGAWTDCGYLLASHWDPSMTAKMLLQQNIILAKHTVISITEGTHLLALQNWVKYVVQAFNSSDAFAMSSAFLVHQSV